MTPVPANLLTRVPIPQGDPHGRGWYGNNSSSLYALANRIGGFSRGSFDECHDAGILWDALVDALASMGREVPNGFLPRKALAEADSNLHHWFRWAVGDGNLFQKRYNAYGSEHSVCFHVLHPPHVGVVPGISKRWHTDNYWGKRQCLTLQVLNQYGLLPEFPYV